MASSTVVITPTQAHRFSTSMSSSSSCPSCGLSLSHPSVSGLDDAQRRIQDLEAQVKLLNAKAAAAVDKLADYEDEVRFLRAANSRSQQNGGPPQEAAQSRGLGGFGSFLRRRNISGDAAIQQQQSPPPTAVSPSQTPYQLSQLRPGTSPILPSNQSTPVLPTLGSALPPSSSPLTLTSLHAALETERHLRQRAETSLTQSQTDLIKTQSELEELTAQLFGQANEMVATERRERAKLEERVKVLEIREREKKGRLERLEERVKRVERVRGMVG